LLPLEATLSKTWLNAKLCCVAEEVIPYHLTRDSGIKVLKIRAAVVGV
jgi:hypothetical protein